MFPCLQSLRVNLMVHGANDLVNNIYQMVQQQKSQGVVESLFWIEESLHHANPKNNIVQEAVSHANQTVILEPIRDIEET